MSSFYRNFLYLAFIYNIINLELHHFLNHSCCVDKVFFFFSFLSLLLLTAGDQCPWCSLRFTKLNVIYTSRGKLSVFAISTQMILWEGNGGLQRALWKTSCCFSSDNGSTVLQLCLLALIAFKCITEPIHFSIHGSPAHVATLLRTSAKRGGGLRTNECKEYYLRHFWAVLVYWFRA